MDDARSQLIFARSAVQRGTFYCTSKINGKCSFTVPFTFMFAQRHYIIKQDTDGFNLDHNHSVVLIPETSDVLVRFERDLWPSEKDLMITCGCHANAPLLRRILATQFPERHYDSHLIQRMIKKSKIANFGSDPDGMKDFFAFGTDISNSGGIFHLEFEDDLRINGAIVQTTAMEKYCRSYSDFTLLDGTFNISVYSLILLVFSNIDCLGKTVIGGIGFAPSENSRSVIKAYQTFYQNFTGASVLMTDGASAFETAAGELRLRHLLCTKHFQKSILHCHRGMNSEFRNTFMRDCHSLLSTVFDSEVSFLDFFYTFYARVAGYGDALRFLDSLLVKKEKVCATFTSKCFTAGHVTTQRAESINARIKESGLNNAHIAKFNLNQLTRHVISLTKRQDLCSLREIQLLIREGRKWSRYVDDRWKAQNLLVSEYESVLVGNLWSVSKRCDNSDPHSVTMLTGQDAFPLCNCAYFVSCQIPCVGICAVFHKVALPLFDIATLAGRWHLVNHPLYEQSLSCLGIVHSNTPPASSSSGHQPTEEVVTQRGEYALNLCPYVYHYVGVSLDLYQRVTVPRTRDVRYRIIDEKCRALASIGSSQGDHVYRLTIAALADAQAVVDAALHGPSSTESRGLLPPLHRNRSSGRPIVEYGNLASLNRPLPSRRPVHCSVCRTAGRSGSLGHRANSRNCPLFQGLYVIFLTLLMNASVSSQNFFLSLIYFVSLFRN